MSVNKNHKASVFSTLFSDPEILKELYSAITGIDVPKDAIVDINTLSDVLYMKQINDLSFTINDRIVVLIEHQSTINENMPLRLLMYIARVYEKIIDRDKLYQKKLRQIPTPEFIVLYNGKENYPDRNELRLSSAFKDIAGLKSDENTNLSLELIVHVYNITHGHNPEILNRSENLNGYSQLIRKIIEYNEKKPLAEALKSAVKYCAEHGILSKFLKNHGSEVLNMLYEEFTVEEIADIRAKEAYEEGREEEKIQIAKNMLSEGLSADFIQKITGLDSDIIKAL